MENLDKSVKYHAEIIVDFEHPTVRIKSLAKVLLYYLAI